MTRMLAGQIAGPRQLEMIELPVPETGEGQMLIEVEASAICGSDLPYFLCDFSNPALAGATIPLLPMLSLHELVGRVVQSRCERYKEGDRVLALPHIKHQGLAEFFLTRPEMAVPVPDGPADRYVLAQPLGTVIHACLKLPNLLGQTAVVVGQGPVGQLFTAVLSRMGVVRLIVVDLLPERLEVSRKMGATDTLCGSSIEVMETVRTMTGGQGVDLVVEAAGRGETLDLALKLVRRNGIVVAFGVPTRSHHPLALYDFFHNEGRLINSVGPNVQHDFPIAVEMIKTGAIDIEPLLTHRLPLRRAPEGFTLFADKAEGVIKVILTTDG